MIAVHERKRLLWSGRPRLIVNLYRETLRNLTSSLMCLRALLRCVSARSRRQPVSVDIARCAQVQRAQSHAGPSLLNVRNKCRCVPERLRTRMRAKHSLHTCVRPSLPALLAQHILDCTRSREARHHHVHTRGKLNWHFLAAERISSARAKHRFAHMGWFATIRFSAFVGNMTAHKTW